MSNYNIVEAVITAETDGGGKKVSIYSYTADELGKLSNYNEIKPLMKELDGIYKKGVNQYFLDKTKGEEGDKRNEKILKNKKDLLSRIESLEVSYKELKKSDEYKNDKNKKKEIDEWNERYFKKTNSQTGSGSLKDDLIRSVGTQENHDKNVNKEKDDDKKKQDKIYKMPEISDKSKEKGGLDDIIAGGDKFVSEGGDSPISVGEIQEMSQKLYNILTELAIGVAVLIGLILGIKLMLAGIDEKAEAKKMMWIYLVGCTIAFGAFGIWKIVIEILEKF